MYYNYHARLKALLLTEPYIVEKGKAPFAVRFIFPGINKSMPIRPYRVPEYKEYLEGVEV